MDLDLTDKQVEAIRILEAIGATVVFEPSTESVKTCNTCFYLDPKYDRYCDDCNDGNKYKQV